MSSARFNVRTKVVRPVLVVLAVALPPIAAQGAVLTVTKVADTSDGACDADCSLREAVIAANGLAGADTISVSAGTYALTIEGPEEELSATGDLDIWDDTSIVGAGSAATVLTMAAPEPDRLIDVHYHPIALTAITVSASGLTIEKGDVRNYIERFGGGIRSYGDVIGSADLTLTDVKLSDNHAQFGGGLASYVEVLPPPGTIAPPGHLTVQSSVVRANTTSGIGTDGFAGIFHTGDADVNDSTIEDNQGTQIGAMFVIFGQLNLRRSTVARNISSEIGGNIAVDTGAALLENSTVSGNVNGGFLGSFGTSKLHHTTFSGNTGASVMSSVGGTVELRNTLVDGSCVSLIGGLFASAGGNVESPAATCGLTQPSDKPSQPSALLGALAANGGPTATHALLAGSPAIGAGLAANCTAVDQRSVSRPQPAGGKCDAGAFELTGCNASLSAAAFVPTALILRRRRRR